MFWWFSLAFWGYGLGSVLGWLVHLGLRRVGRRLGARLRRAAWATRPLVVVVMLVTVIVVWPRWQNAQRVLVGAADVVIFDALASVVVAAVFVLVLGAGCRFVWWQVRGIDRWFDRRVSHSVALIGTVVIVTLAAQIVMREVVWGRLRLVGQQGVQHRG